MNMSLSEVLRTARNGQITKLPNVYLRGSSIRFIALPELLKNAPVFQKVTAMKRKMEAAQQQRQQQAGKSILFMEQLATTLLRISCWTELLDSCAHFVITMSTLPGGQKRKRGD